MPGQKPKTLQARRGFTCDAGEGPVYVPRHQQLRNSRGGLVDLSEYSQSDCARQAEETPEWFDLRDATPVIVRAGDRYPSDHAVVQGREHLFEEVA